MKIAVPKEIKNNENRVGLVPAGVRQLVDDGHELLFKKDAGIGIGIRPRLYRSWGKILPTLEDCFATGEMIIKVKEPQPVEIALIKTSSYSLYVPTPFC
jgi:alanine dehydrogenase